MSSVSMQTQRWCGQDHTTVSVESSTSSDRQQRRPDVRRNSGDMTAQPADDWQQNADVALMQSQTLERSQVLSSSTVQTASRDYADMGSEESSCGSYHQGVKGRIKIRSSAYMAILPLTTFLGTLSNALTRYTKTQ